MRELLALLHLMHEGVSVESRRKALEILDTIFANIINYPLITKYKRINMTSLSWTSHITPVFHLFDLIEWLKTIGFEQDLENSFLIFINNDLNQIIKSREELCILIRAYRASSTEKKLNNAKRKNNLLLLLRSIVGISNSGNSAVGEKQTNLLIPNIYITNEIWNTIRDGLYLSVLESEVLTHTIKKDKSFFKPPIPPISPELWASLIEASHELTLSEIEEDFTVVNTELFHINQSSKNYTINNNIYLEKNARKRVAERHKQSILKENSNQSKVHLEVQLVAIRLIADIASCIEQIAVIEGQEGIVRKDRLEARSLLSKFNEDGDIEYLHRLKDEWFEKLESTKERLGKPLVYL